VSEEEPFGPRVRALLGLEPAEPPSEVQRLRRQLPWAFDFALAHATATDLLRRRVPRKRPRGRPRGSTWIRSPEAVRAAYRDALADPTVRPTQEEVAHRLGRGVTTLKEYMTRKGMSWPPD
jgi:hypothetical protein